MKKLILVIAFILFSLNFISAQEYNCPGFGMMGYNNGTGIVFGWIFMTLVVVALVLLIVWLYKQIQKKK